MAFNKRDYPENWKAITASVRLAAEHACECCGIGFAEGTNYALVRIRKDGKPMIGTVHHIDHDRANNRPNNLVYLCQSCHLRVQHWKPFNGQTLPSFYGKPPRWIIKRGLTKAQKVLAEENHESD